MGQGDNVSLQTGHLVRQERDGVVQGPAEGGGGVAVTRRAGQVGGVVREGEAGRGGDGEDQPGDQSLELAGSVEGHHAGPDPVLGCSQAGQSQLAVLVSGGEDRPGSLLGPAHLLRPDQPLLPPQPDLAPPLPTRAQPDTQQPRPWCWAGEDDLATRHHAVHQPVHGGRQTETSHHSWTAHSTLSPLMRVLKL